MLENHSFTLEIGGRTLSIDSGKLAEQANGAVTVRYGDTVVLVTVCNSSKPREGVDFLPLTIDFEERMYAAGKIPGGFIRREGRPSQEATLASRLTDRPLRPLLPKDWRKDIQIIITVLSVDQENDTDILAVIGGSAALSISDIPFYGPVSAVHVGYLNGELVLNPKLAELESSLFDLVVVSTKNSIVMIEAGSNEAPEDLMLEAMKLGHEANQRIIELQEQLQQALGKSKQDAPVSEIKPEVITEVSAIVDHNMDQAVNISDKAERETALGELKKDVIEQLGEKYQEKELLSVFETKVKSLIRSNIMEKQQRVDGRNLTDIRPLSCEVGLLPRTHGSALFNRGQTQVLAITTLGSAGQEQKLDGLGIKDKKRFIHHYNFTPFSTGEAKRVGSTSRREIGHGALAERAIIPVLPSDEDFPYTIRVVSEVLSSQGSTSMASTCSSSMSLMDAGVPIKKAVAGIAMGLVTDDAGKYVILTDIAGLEDAYGDMDFKVAGTADGITAMQMDTKIKGITLEMVEKTLTQAREARMSILETMNKTIDANRLELSKYAPRMHTIKINQENIGSVIGPGGKTIRSIISETNVTIDIAEDGTVVIGSSDEASAKKAIGIIEGLTKEIEVGAIYTGKVSRIMNFGAMVEILPGKEGLVHISQLADYRVNTVEDEVKLGDEITVKVIEIDSHGRTNLSRKAVFEDDSDSSRPGMRNSPPNNRPFRR